MYSKTMAIKAVKRLMFKIDETLYSIVYNNCEHLSSYSFQGSPTSDQIEEMPFKGQCFLKSFQTLIEVGNNGLLSCVIYFADLLISPIIKRYHVYLPFGRTIEENDANTIFEISWNSVIFEIQLDVSQLYLKELKKVLTQANMFAKGFESEEMKIMCRFIGGIIGWIVHARLGAPHTNIPTKYTNLSYIVGATSGLVIGSIMPNSLCPTLGHICVLLKFAPVLITCLKCYTISQSIQWSVENGENGEINT